MKWTADRHRAIHRAVAAETLTGGLILVRPADIPSVRRAIYLAVGAGGDFLYCGKVMREHRDALRQRFHEHLTRDRRREHTWQFLCVMPLPDGLTDGEVRRREGIAAALAGYPKEGKAWRRPA